MQIHEWSSDTSDIEFEIGVGRRAIYMLLDSPTGGSVLRSPASVAPVQIAPKSPAPSKPPGHKTPKQPVQKQEASGVKPAHPEPALTLREKLIHDIVVRRESVATISAAQSRQVDSASHLAAAYNKADGERDTWLPWSRNDDFTGADLLGNDDLEGWARYNERSGNRAAAQALRSVAQIQVEYRKLEAQRRQVHREIGALTVQQIRLSFEQAMNG